MRLTILDHAGVPPQSRVSALFSAPGATIGRGADNHLVLADDTRQISRLQASLRVGDSGAYLSNLSTVCPVLVNEQPVAGDRPQRLQPGDIITIGAYRLVAGEIDEATAPPQPRMPERPQVVMLPTPTPHAEPLGVAMPGIQPPSDSSASFMDLFAAPATPDPLGAPMAPVVAPAPAARSHDAFWDELTSEFAPSPETAARFAPVHEQQQLAPLALPIEPAPAPTPETDDPLASLANASLDPLSLFASAPDDGASDLFNDSASILPAESSALAELRERQEALPLQVSQSPLFDAAPPPDSQPPAAAPNPAPMPAPTAHVAPMPAAHGAADANRLAQAFLEGAGITLDNTLTEDQFRQAGRLLNQLIGGSMDLLASRAIIKREVKAEMTMLLDRENNPLKLLPDARMVLKQMFGPPFPGFMSPERAIDDTFHDLQAHQMGMLAGMRAALNQVLHNFSPEVVDRQMGADIWYERLMPKGRDGRAWVRYRALHAAAVAAVEDDFHKVFGQAFLAAYDAEVELYRSQRQARAC